MWEINKDQSNSKSPKNRRQRVDESKSNLLIGIILA
jgi:hypothetical protein